MAANPEDNRLISMSILDHLNIRLARPEDAAMIASFSAAMALETEGRHLDRDRLHNGTIALLHSPDRGFFLVAELEQADDRRLLGQLMITYEWSDWRNGVFWWIQSVYVDPAWRRQSVFRLCTNMWSGRPKRGRMSAASGCMWSRTTRRRSRCITGWGYRRHLIGYLKRTLC